MKPQLIVWWTLWSAFQIGICVIYFFIGRLSPTVPASADSISWLVAIAPVLFSTVVRWVILPRVAAEQTAIVLFVIGIALAEAACFLGIFLFPMHKLELFVLSAFGIFQYVPYYAARYFDGEGR